jgi:hypothetical protein
MQPFLALITPLAGPELPPIDPPPGGGGGGGGSGKPNIPTFPIALPPGSNPPDKPGYPPWAGHPLPPWTPGIPPIDPPPVLPPDFEPPPPGSVTIPPGYKPVQPIEPPPFVLIFYPGVGWVLVGRPIPPEEEST